MSDVSLKMRTASTLFSVGASFINDEVLIESANGWRPLTDSEEKEVLKYLINTQKEDAKDSILHFLAEVRAKITGYVDQYKLAGWSDKSQRAQRVINNTASEADITILQTECDKRGKNETPQELAQKQADKGQNLATAVALIDGFESAALDAIETKRSEKTLAALLDDLQKQANQQLEHLLGG